MGTIRREGPLQNGNPQRLHVWDMPVNLDAQWIVGFVDGEGCFHVGINPHEEMTAGFQVLPEFTVVQHLRDVQILYALKSHFGCGVVRTNHGERMAYRVRGINHLLGTIIPFFEQHQLKSKKRQDFQIFRQILHKMAAGEHLAKSGIEEIRKLAGKMNRGNTERQVKIKSGCSGNTMD
jgi:hypothetical protein